MAKLHALLIGIDAYDGKGSLRGCVNDVDHIQRILLDRVGVPAELIRRLASPRPTAVHDETIKGEIPTLATIKRELERLAADEVAPVDRVFIFYSGHGTQLTLRDARGKRYPREALLPKDKVDGSRPRYLLDWELNAYLVKIAQRCHSATIILDCCSSAGATREIEPAGDERFFPMQEAIPYEEALSLGETARGVAENCIFGAANVQVVAACQANEKAREDKDRDGGLTMSHLTRSFCERLTQIDDNALRDLRWGRIWRQVESGVLDRNCNQHPWISAGFARPVFGGAASDVGDMGFRVEQKGNTFHFDVGKLAGVTRDSVIGVYGHKPVTFPPLKSPADQEARVGDVRITESEQGHSSGFPLEPFELPEGARGRLVQSGEEGALHVLRPADNKLAALLEASASLRLVDEPSDADIQLVQVDGGWRLTDEFFGVEEKEPRFPLITKRQIALEFAEHYNDYRAPLRYARRCKDLPQALQISILDCNDVKVTADNAQTVELNEVGGSQRARYEIESGQLACVEVFNHSDRDLHVTLFDVAASGKVLLLGESQIPKRARHDFWGNDVLGTPFQVNLDDDVALGVDRLVAIGTTDPAINIRHLKLQSSFAKIVNPPRSAERDMTPIDDEAEETLVVEHYTSVIAPLWIRKENEEKK